MAIFLALGAVGASVLTVRLHNRSSAQATISPFGPASRAVVITLDGVSPSELRAVAMPNLAALYANGITYGNAWIGQIEATPAASAATISTGVLPREHGILGDVWFDARAGHIVRPTTPDQVLVGSLDAIMEPRGLSSVAASLKVRNPSARVLSVAGTNCAAASAAGTWVADYIVCASRRGRQWVPVTVAGHSLPPLAAANGVTAAVVGGGGLAAAVEGWALGRQDRWIAGETVHVMRATHPRLTLVSFPEPAVVGQYAPAGDRPRLLRAVLTGLDRDIGTIVNETKREGVFRRTVFVLTSGRAIAPVRSAVPAAQLSAAIVAAGGQPVYTAGDHAAFIGLRDPLQAQPVAQAMLGGHTGNVDAVFFKSGSGTSWQYQPQYLAPSLSPGFSDSCAFLLGTMASAPAPDVVVVYRPGAALRPAALGGVPRTGGGLGLQWEDQHVPLLISGHGVYAGRTSAFPARLVDIAPTLEALLGLPIESGSGVVLRDALYQPIPGEDVQSAEARRLERLVSALRDRVKGVRG